MAGNHAGEEGGAVYLCCCSDVDLENCTLADNQAPGGSAVFAVGMSIGSIARSIIALNEGGEAVFFRHSGLALESTDVFGNPGGDWVGEIAKERSQNHNLSADPAFVGRGAGNYALAPDSPCRLRIDGEEQTLGAIP